MTITEKFDYFQYQNFETNFSKIKPLFNNLEYHFFVESTKIENVILRYKTALSEANAKTNGMGSKK